MVTVHPVGQLALEPSQSSGAHAAGGVPGVASRHVPAASQLSHGPSQADAQQTPLAQKPDWQLPSFVHASPRLSVGAHWPAEQNEPATQSASVAHCVRHAVAPQTYGVQSVAVPGRHAPSPLQSGAGIDPPSRQDAVPHGVVADGYTHAAVSIPLHAPPQTVPSVAHAGRVPTGAPETGLHCPTLPGRSQAAHCS